MNDLSIEFGYEGKVTAQDSEDITERIRAVHARALVDDVVVDIRGAMELWPTLVEICYFRKHRKDLPQTRVRNQKRA